MFSSIEMNNKDNFIFNKYKSNVIFIHFSLDQLYNFNSFKQKFLDNNLNINTYTVYVKVRYSRDNLFMAGNQFGFIYDNHNDIFDLYNDINLKLNEYFNYYHLNDEDIVYIQVCFRSIISKIKTDLSLDKNQVTDLIFNKNRRILDLVKIPLSTSQDILPKQLKVGLDDNMNINKVLITINDQDINFIDVILNNNKLLKNYHKDNITIFDTLYRVL